MSVDLGLSAVQRDVEALFASFFTNEAPPTVARAAEPLGFDPLLWTKLRTTGATAMAAEGATLAELVVVVEQLGRAVAPVPLVEHLVAVRAHPAADLLDGSAIGAVALRPARHRSWRLVAAGAVGDVVIGVDSAELVAVRNPPPGDAPRNHACAPIADRSTAGERVVIGSSDAIDAVIADWQLLCAAALVGVAQQALDMGVDYAKTRVQFGVPIGSFQAVQHGLAELPGLIDGARLLVHKAAWAAMGTAAPVVDVDDAEITDPRVLASMAFLFAADVAARATERSLHFHGGYGFAQEYDIQLFYRRARGWALVFGDPAHEALRLADRLFPEAGVR